MSKPESPRVTPHWRSRAQLEAGPEAQQPADEFPGLKEAMGEGLVTIKRPGGEATLGRRSFFGLTAGVGSALATGCVRKPVERIVPFAKRPEDMIPGKPEYYATAYQIGETVLGVLVESQDGRPTKIEGNPKHESSGGATDVWAQASVLDLYDPDRSQLPHKRGEDGKPAPTDWGVVDKELGAALAELEKSQGAGLALVLPTVVSPTLRSQLAGIKKRFPKVRMFEGDWAGSANSNAALRLLTGAEARLSYELVNAKTILALDCDFLATEQDHVRLAHEYARGRDVGAPSGDKAPEMNRLYAVEPHFTITGMQADHRLAIRAAEVGPLLIDLCKQLTATFPEEVRWDNEKLTALFATTPETFDAEAKVLKGLDPQRARFLKAAAADLVDARQTAEKFAVIMVGERQPVWVHALATAVNAALRSFGSACRIRIDAGAHTPETLLDLAKALDGQEVASVICLGTNPAYDAPGSLNLPALLERASLLVHAGLHIDETARLAHWHLPLSHYLEAWGDLESTGAAVTICQPLIEPLYGETRSPIELAAWMATGAQKSGHDLVRAYWKAELGSFWSDREWRRWLHDGLVVGAPRDVENIQIKGWDAFTTLLEQEAAATVPQEGFELNFHLDPKVADGRFANNPWMQELPHPMSKLTWDNGVYLNPSVMAELQLENGDLVRVESSAGQLTAPVWEAPGQAAGTASVTLGGGRRELGYFAGDSGVDVAAVRDAANPWFIGQVRITKSGGKREIFSTQDHGSLYPGFGYPTRPIVRESTLANYAENPGFSQEGDLMKPEQLKSLWEHNDPNGVLGEPVRKGLQQWGMVIDLNKCTGCNACVVACQSENNIPVVGRKEISNGRELHWIRLDRYYTGSLDEPQALVQPMLCQHCETAPCESVCPVNATTHSPEGLNDMAYNRCVGTRYCANNCPYKVRRFNFFNYNRWMEEGQHTDLPYRAGYSRETPGLRKYKTVKNHYAMARNPDVTVRFCGVIEKCSYCVQRINEAKIEAKVDGYDTVRDGAIVTACQQVCPTRAITFGDVADPETRVSKLRNHPRNYEVLRDLYTRPRTTYLARVRNPNPELA